MIPVGAVGIILGYTSILMLFGGLYFYSILFVIPAILCMIIDINDVLSEENE